MSKNCYVVMDNMSGEILGKFSRLDDAINYARTQGIVPWGSGRAYVIDSDNTVIWALEKEQVK